MTIEVKAPDGATIRFPAGTPDDVIVSVMRREYGGPEPAGGKNVRPGDVQQPVVMSDDPAHDQSGLFFPEGPSEPRTPQPGDVLNRGTILPFVETMGPDGRPRQSFGLPGIVSDPIEAADRLVSRPAAPGTGDNEKLVPDATTVALSALPGARTARQLPSQETQELARNLAAQVGPQLPHRPPAPAAAAQQGIGEMARELGVDLPRAAAGGRAAQIAGGVVRELPWVGTPVVNAARRATDQLEGAVTRVADDLGPSSREGAGTAARDEMAAWIRGGSHEPSRRAYQELDGLINPSVTVQLPELNRTVKDILARDQISATRDGAAAVALVSEALKRPQGLTYEGVKGLRTSIFDRLDGNITGHGISQKNLMRLKAALDKDVRFAVERSGVAGKGKARALEAFERANSMYADASRHREALTKIIGTQADASGEAIVDRIRSMAGASKGADIARIIQARVSLSPEAWDDVAGAIVRSMGQTPKGWSLAHWRTDYGKLSTEGRNALFGSGAGSHHDTLNKIFELGSHAEALQRMGNPSQSGRFASLVAAPTAALSAPFALATTVFGGRMLANILSKPVSAKALLELETVAQQHAKAPSGATMLMLSQAVRQIAVSAGEDGDEAERRLRAALEDGPPRPASIEEAKKLKPGTRFIDPNGVERVR